MKNIAIVLAGGSGSRMQSDCPKQFMPLCGKPILYYALSVMEQHEVIDEVVLVTRDEDLSYCKEEIVKKYGFAKVSHIVSGGAERYLSVYEGLRCCDGADYVFVHDGARPFPDSEMMNRLNADVKQYGSAVAAVPTKDTIKIADADGYVASTPNRSSVWNIQTPQVFAYQELKSAYEAMLADANRSLITDDAMVMEQYSDCRVHLTMGSYDNLKITTPEDIRVAESFLNKETNS